MALPGRIRSLSGAAFLSSSSAMRENSTPAIWNRAAAAAGSSCSNANPGSRIGRPNDPNLAEDSDPNTWDEYQGDGFSVKIPPGFEDTLEPDEFPVGEVPLYGNRAKPKIFAARFASPDGEEFVSVVVRRASQLKATFFEAKSITDLGKVDDIATLFLPVGARLTASSSVTSESQRVYYLYEYLAGSKHVVVSAAAMSGRIFVAAATAPQSRWNEDGRMLSSAAASFYLL